MKLFSAARGAADEYRGILTRLRRDASGNTLALIAMATIPLAGMVGSAVDIGRSYMIKSRLQQACDAGVLATRRSMSGVVLDTNSQTQGTRFFNINFAAGTAGATNIGFGTTGNSEGLVTGTATARIPMTITKIFGSDYVDLSLTCEARLDVSNTDVMFVLDTTGSMLDCPDGSTCSGGTGSKIVGLRQAVNDFYSTLAAAAPATAQIRYGFVPYSSTVNVGSLLMSANSGWVANSHNYRSRVANFTTAVPSVVTTETYGSTLTSANCNTYGVNKSYPTLDGASSSTTDAGGVTTTTTYSFKDWGATGTTSGTNRTCRRTKTVSVAGFKFTNFTYGATSIDTSVFETGSTIAVANGTPGSTDYVPTSSSYNMVQLAALPNYTGGEESTTWDGCIEERDTVPNSTFTYGSIPSNAYDLDIDTLPTNYATSWRAAWPQNVWDPSPPSGYFGSPGRPWDYRTNGFYACPTAARKLSTMTATAVSTYVNSLTPLGGTYHDSGMIWGSRLISPTGLFASENATAPNGLPISRHIIFMTDGQTAPNPMIYGLYGYERLDQRVTGGTVNTSDFTDLTNRHNSRYVAMCNAIRAKNVSIWVVGFGQTLNSQMTACADPGQAFYASDTTTLRSQFTAIATKIAKLRLSK